MAQHKRDFKVKNWLIDKLKSIGGFFANIGARILLGKKAFNELMNKEIEKETAQLLKEEVNKTKENIQNRKDVSYSIEDAYQKICHKAQNLQPETGIQAININNHQVAIKKGKDKVEVLLDGKNPFYITNDVIENENADHNDLTTDALNTMETVLEQAPKKSPYIVNEHLSNHQICTSLQQHIKAMDKLLTEDDVRKNLPYQCDLNGVDVQLRKKGNYISLSFDEDKEFVFEPNDLKGKKLNEEIIAMAKTIRHEANRLETERKTSIPEQSEIIPENNPFEPITPDSEIKNEQLEVKNPEIKPQTIKLETFSPEKGLEKIQDEIENMEIDGVKKQNMELNGRDVSITKHGSGDYLINVKYHNQDDKEPIIQKSCRLRPEMLQANFSLNQNEHKDVYQCMQSLGDNKLIEKERLQQGFNKTIDIANQKARENNEKAPEKTVDYRKQAEEKLKNNKKTYNVAKLSPEQEKDSSLRERAENADIQETTDLGKDSGTESPTEGIDNIADETPDDELGTFIPSDEREDGSRKSKEVDWDELMEEAIRESEEEQDKSVQYHINKNIEH